MCTSIMKYKLMKNLSDRILLARMQLHACRFRLANKKTQQHRIRDTMFNFQFLDKSIWHQNYKKKSWNKVDIPSNFNGIFRQLSCNYLKTLYSWNILKFGINLHEIKELQKQKQSCMDIGHILTKRPICMIAIQGKMFKLCINRNKHEQENR